MIMYVGLIHNTPIIHTTKRNKINHDHQVMLFAQGVETAEELSGKIVLLFQLCEEQLSPQPHYDFGLRVRTRTSVYAPSSPW